MMIINCSEIVGENSAGRRHGFYSPGRGRLFLLTLCSLMILMSGCSTGNLKHYLRSNVDISAIKTIAVLPLKNFTSDNHAGEKIRSKISIELLTRDINIVEPGEIAMTLKELKIRSVDSMRNEDMVSIGNMLNTDAVITGSVETYGISRGITVSYPEVSVHLMMFDTASGNIIWSAWHTTGGASFWTRHFGAEGDTLDKVSERVIKEAINSLY